MAKKNACLIILTFLLLLGRATPTPATCPAGQYFHIYVFFAGCDFCDAGSMCPGDDAMHLCGAGTWSGYRDTSCHPCTAPPGSTCGAGSTSPNGTVCGASVYCAGGVALPIISPSSSGHGTCASVARRA